MLRKKLAVLVAAAVMVLSMLAAAPVFAQGEGGCDPQPGQTEKSQGPGTTPPQGKPGLLPSQNPAVAADPTTGFGERVDECA